MTKHILKKLEQHDEQFLNITKILKQHDRQFIKIDEQFSKVNERLENHDKRFDRMEKADQKRDETMERMQLMLVEHDKKLAECVTKTEFREFKSEVNEKLDMIIDIILDMRQEKTFTDARLQRHEKNIVMLNKKVFKRGELVA